MKKTQNKTTMKQAKCEPSLNSGDTSNSESKDCESRKARLHDKQKGEGNFKPKKLKVNQDVKENVIAENLAKDVKSSKSKVFPKKFVGINYTHPKYKENEIMTKFEGIWILKKNLKLMKKLSKKNKLRVISDRKNGKTSLKLTPSEKQLYKEKMKLSRKFQVESLERVLKAMNQKRSKQKSLKHKQKKPGKYLDIHCENKDLVKFGHGRIKKEAAERIQNLCDSMRTKGVSEEKIKVFLKYEQRKAEREFKKEQRKAESVLKNDLKLKTTSTSEVQVKNYAAPCIKCDSTEHFATHCPLNKKDNVCEKGLNVKCSKYNEIGGFTKPGKQILKVCESSNMVKHFSKICANSFESSEKSNIVKCYRCNEVGHFSKSCPNSFAGGENSVIVKCYKCNKVGHFSKSCPNVSEASEDAIIVKCYKCNEVGHFSKNCPKISEASEDSKIVKCFKCNGVGHFSRNCPKSSEACEISNIEKCFKCNETGHSSKNCPARFEGGGNSGIVKCYKCNKVGHFSKSCPNVSEASEDAIIIKCYKCNEVGHFSKNCPKISKASEDAIIVKCYKCNEVGHFSKNCPKISEPNEDSKIVKCFKCNGVGHFSKSCTFIDENARKRSQSFTYSSKG